jgi:hypothetical protein
MLFLAPANRVVDTDLGRVDVDHPPRQRPAEDLTQRLRRLEAVSQREFHPPLGDLLRCQLADLPIAEGGGCLAEQVAELLDRHRLDVVLRQIRLDELAERERPCDAVFSPKPLEFTLKRLARFLCRDEPASLNTLGVAAAGPVAIRPQPLTITSATLQLECLSLLHHR